MPIRRHLDERELLLAAIEFTAAENKFTGRLVEKDYFCTVALEYLTSPDDRLIFKGGTCLSKVHSDFFRLSEDLDFSIRVESDVTRRQRRELIEPIKRRVACLNDLPGFEVESDLMGANQSTQYNAVLRYRSLITGDWERIKIEIGLRENVLDGAMRRPAKTLVLDPIGGKRELVERIEVPCLSFEEAMAEKVRAALTRREIAIRDFFDVYHSVSSGNLDIESENFHNLLRAKLATKGTGSADLSEERIDQLHRQLDTELKAVLRTRDFDNFDLDQAIETVQDLADAIAYQPQE